MASNFVQWIYAMIFLNWYFHADRTLKLKNMYQWDFTTFKGGEYFADGQYSSGQTQKGKKVHVLYVDSHIVQGKRHGVKPLTSWFISLITVFSSKAMKKYYFLCKMDFQGKIISKWILRILSVSSKKTCDNYWDFGGEGKNVYNYW